MLTENAATFWLPPVDLPQNPAGFLVNVELFHPDLPQAVAATPAGNRSGGRIRPGPYGQILN